MMQETTVREGFAQVWRTCPVCGGDEVVRAPHCARCGAAIPEDDPWWETDADTLPCGHPAGEHLVELVQCKECDGSGRVMAWVTETEYRARRRRKLVRGLFLLLAGLIPVALLAWAVFTRDTQYVCGSLWYGVVPVGYCAWRLAVIGT